VLPVERKRIQSPAEVGIQWMVFGIHSSIVANTPSLRIH
jgi:hypothetical protein